MKKGDSKTKNGFTIIEVSLVLAIAGLIFLMMLVALPALRASERDTERREAVVLLIDAIKKYQSNNRGALPSNWTTFRNKYLGSNWVEPLTGEKYTINVKDCGATTGANCTNAGFVSDVYNKAFDEMKGKMVVVKKATCDGTRAKGTSNPRKVAVLYRLERADVYCANS